MAAPARHGAAVILGAMYAGYFGLQQAPFSIAPDPRYLFMSERHREALAHLLYGLQGGGGFVLLTGEIGAGKTTIGRCFLQQLPPHCKVAYIFNPKLTVVELLQTICHEFQVPVAHAGGGLATVKDHLDPLNEHLLRSHAAGQHNLLVIDEAQNLSADVLEQLRLLTNLETNERKLLQIILIGQPELRALLARPELEQLAQRVVARFHLGALSEAETRAYIQHRLAVAGFTGPLPFADDALRRIHALSRGVPRRINLLCDRALLGAYATGVARVDRAVVDQAAAEVFASDTPAPQPANSPAQRQRLGTLALGAVGGAASAALLLGLWGGAWPGLRVALKATDKDPATTAQTSTTAPNTTPNTATATPNNPPTATPQTTTTPTTTPTESDPNPSSPNLPSSAATAAIATAPSPNASNPALPAALTPSPATAEPEPSLGPPPGSALWRSEADALRALGAVWASPLSGADPCASAQAQGLQCFRISRMTLHGLRQMDRPAVLWLRRPGHSGWVLLSAMGPETATLSTAEGRWRLPLTALADIWRGDYATLWRTPPGQQGRLAAGHSGPAADWLAQQLQQLQAQGQIDAKAQDFAERIRAFQHSQGLDGDGLAGPITFMLVNRASGVAEPRLGRD